MQLIVWSRMYSPVVRFTRDIQNMNDEHTNDMHGLWFLKWHVYLCRYKIDLYSRYVIFTTEGMLMSRAAADFTERMRSLCIDRTCMSAFTWCMFLFHIHQFANKMELQFSLSANTEQRPHFVICFKIGQWRQILLPLIRVYWNCTG